MKLYATVSSERASKGQGGNNYLDIIVRDERERPIALFSFYPDAAHRATLLRGVEFDMDTVDAIELNRASCSCPAGEDAKVHHPTCKGLKKKGEKQKGEEACVKCAAKAKLYATAYKQGGWHCFNCGHDNTL